MSTMNERIQRIVDFNGLSKTAFGRKINLSQSMVSKLCSGAATPSDRTIADICRVFNVNETWLLTGEGEMIDYATREAKFRTVFLTPDHDNQNLANEIGKLCNVLAQLPDYVVDELVKKWTDSIMKALEQYKANENDQD